MPRWSVISPPRSLYGILSTAFSLCSLHSILILAFSLRSLHALLSVAFSLRSLHAILSAALSPRHALYRALFTGLRFLHWPTFSPPHRPVHSTLSTALCPPRLLHRAPQPLSSPRPSTLWRNFSGLCNGATEAVVQLLCGATSQANAVCVRCF